VVITDTEGTIQYVNPAFEGSSGYRRKEVVGRNPRMLKSGRHDAAFYDEMWSTLSAGKVWRGVLTNRHKDGSLFEEKTTISPVRNDEGEIVHYVGVKRDTTKESRLERELRQSQKLQAVGTLAGGIAHDFNNLLQVITANASLLTRALPPEGPSADSLSDLRRASDRAAELVGQILTFSRRSERQPRVLPFRAVVEEALELMRSTLPATVEIVTELTEQSTEILADHTELTQLVMNLCTNAAQSMGDSCGTITVELTKLEVKPEESGQTPPGDYARFSLSDDGAGMDPATRERLFEPYFTTRDQEGGSGMGLAIVHGIVESLQGTIHVESTPGSGSCFTVLLPLTTEAPRSEIQEEVEPPASGSGERLLYVDDEEMVANVMSRGLTELGYRVDSFTSPNEALAAFRKDPIGYAALITDQIMPGLTGLELIRELLAIRPDLPVLLCTGHNTVEDEQRALFGGAHAFLTKPFGIQELGVSLRQILPKGKNGSA
jgi:two-component system, cell cycle sensor histidine kinase and response regulator CckA